MKNDLDQNRTQLLTEEVDKGVSLVCARLLILNNSNGLQKALNLRAGRWEGRGSPHISRLKH